MMQQPLTGSIHVRIPDDHTECKSQVTSTPSGTRGPAPRLGASVRVEPRPDGNRSRFAMSAPRQPSDVSSV